MPRSKKIPLFSLPYYSQRHKYGTQGIEAGKSIYHALNCPTQLYEAFGYDKQGMLPDEFIWEHFTKPEAPKRTRCIQSIIWTFLYHNSDRFRAEYGEQYEAMKGQCAEDAVDGSNACVGCMAHPHNHTKND